MILNTRHLNILSSLLVTPSPFSFPLSYIPVIFSAGSLVPNKQTFGVRDVLPNKHREVKISKILTSEPS